MQLNLTTTSDGYAHKWVQLIHDLSKISLKVHSNVSLCNLSRIFIVPEPWFQVQVESVYENFFLLDFK